jgi:hypothetical protein
MQMLAAASLAAIVLVYPMLRGVDLIPTERLVSIAEMVDESRAGSLQYRFDNEDMLLQRANERPLFGWGSWGRNRVFDDAGRDISTTDGAWIITIGSYGWIGYLAQFGLLSGVLLLLVFQRRSYEISSVTAILMLVLAASLIDLLPNSFLSPIVLLMAGALWGRLELGRLANTAAETETGPAGEIRCVRETPARNFPSAGRDMPAYTRQAARRERVRKYR